MSLALYNTLTRTVELFAPQAPPRVTLYTCGPTVWNYAHLGNFRTFVFEDVLRRYLEYRGYDVLHVMNLTDVDDRTIKAASAAGVPLARYTGPFARAFIEDRDYLRILPAHHYPAATAHIPQMVSLVQRLLDRGVAYKGEDGSVYFAIAKFPGYGRLSRVESRELKTGARVDSDEYSKEDARDFALWKAAKPEDERAGAAWDAPFGRGRPGWHLECSAMSQHYLGDTLDIHAGGVDLIFPHHEDEIAQSEAATGRPLARLWLHAEFLLVEGTKMSKRYGNFLTVRDLREDGWDPAAIRFLFASTHYRKQLNFTDDALGAAAAGAGRLGEFYYRLQRSRVASAAAPAWAAATDRLATEFVAAMDDDLDAPRALGSTMDFVREGNKLLDAGAGASKAALELFDRIVGVLQVVPAPPIVADDNVRLPFESSGTATVPDAGTDAWARAVAERRAEHRKRKEWAKADEARKLLLQYGFDVRDTRDGGYELRRVNKPPPTP